MLFSVILFFLLIAFTFYIHQYLQYNIDNNTTSFKKPQRYRGKYDNYNDIITDTPLASPDAEIDSGSISIKKAMNNDDVLSVNSDNMSIISLEENETLNCNNGDMIEMPRGFDEFQTNNDTAKHVFSNKKQMRVFDKHDFVKEIGNGRVAVDTTNSRELPSIGKQQEPQPLSNFPTGFSSLSGYGEMMAGYDDNNPSSATDNSYMSGVVPYQG